MKESHIAGFFIYKNVRKEVRYMQVDISTVINGAALLTAVITILGAIVAAVTWFLKQKKQDDDIASIKEENTVICYGLRACLDGLEQLGANHSVPLARDKLDKHLNKKAHDQK